MEREHAKSLQKIERLEQRLDLEGSLWHTNENDSRLDRISQFPLMHRLESLDDIIADPDKLRPSTGFTCEIFEFVLNLFEWRLERDDQAPLFRDAKKRAADPDNRCKLYPQHVLFMALMRKRSNVPQGVLEAIFGVNQSTICRYLQVSDSILEKILPTVQTMMRAISMLMSSPQGQPALEKLFEDKIMIVDGTHTPIKRPG